MAIMDWVISVIHKSYIKGEGKDRHIFGYFGGFRLAKIFIRENTLEIKIRFFVKKVRWFWPFKHRGS